MATWKELITTELTNQGETWQDVKSCTLTESELHIEFDDGYGGVEGKPFTLWTRKRVYFPICYDGAEWCASVSRIINKTPTDHLGGG